MRTADDGESEDLAPWRAIDPSRRRFRRWTVDLEAELRLAERTFTCLVHDLSPGGARIDLTGTEAPAIGTEVVLTMDGYGSISSEVRYAEGGELGLRFIHDSADEVRLARFLVAQAPPRQPPRHAVEIGGLLTAGNVQVSCAVADLSDSGARVRLRDTDHLSEGDRVVLHIDGHGDLAATVRRIGDAEIGVAFEQPSETAPVEATGSGSVLTRLRNWLRRRPSS